MVKPLLEPIEAAVRRKCRIHTGPAEYYCVRCNWRGDSAEDAREEAPWQACPICRGHVLPWERRRRS
jgi:hypothetical protein